jgi:hypothetical protein
MIKDKEMSTALDTPPCDSTDATCGSKFTRTVGCYFVPPNITPATTDWIKQSTLLDPSQCSFTLGTYAFDEKGNKLVVPAGGFVTESDCPACSIYFGVQEWIQNCACSSTDSSDTCTLGPDLPGGGKNPFGRCAKTEAVCHSNGCVVTSSSAAKASYNQNMKNNNAQPQMHNMHNMHNMRLNNSTTQPQMYNMRLNNSTTQPQMHNMYNMRLNNSRANTTTQPQMHYRYNNQCY